MTMLKLQNSNLSSPPTLIIGVGGIVVGLAVGFLTGVNPLLVGVTLFAVALVFWFFAKFEQAVIGLLILRSSLDIFTTSLMPSAMNQIPGVFTLGLDVLILLYVTVQLMLGRSVRTDKFWWFFAGWVVLQGLWLILLPLGGLGLDGSFLADSIREWIRIFSLMMVYLLAMQLVEKIHPEKIISLLFFSLVVPLTIALIQIFLPSVIPPLTSTEGLMSEGSRIFATFGHPNSFAVYLLLFISLTWWKLSYSKQRLPWLALLVLLVFILSTTKTLIALLMLFVFVLIMIAPQLTPKTMIAGIVLFVIVFGLFASTEFGQQRLASIVDTPLLNPDIDVSRAILLSKADNNSFNWRIAQWTHLLQAWQQLPMLGYGLGLSRYVSTNGLVPHNDYIKALVEGGVFGLVNMLMFFVVQFAYLVNLLRRIDRGTRQHQLSLMLLAVFIATLIGMLSENIGMCTAFYFYYWTAFAVTGWNWEETGTSNKSMVGSNIVDKKSYCRSPELL